MHRILLAVVAAALGTPAVALAQEPLELDSRQVPDEDNFEEWLEFIRPSEDELVYEKIGWRNKFWSAVQEAKELGRPILLWTMNGHPLGCT